MRESRTGPLSQGTATFVAVAAVVLLILSVALANRGPTQTFSAPVPRPIEQASPSVNRPVTVLPKEPVHREVPAALARELTAPPDAGSVIDIRRAEKLVDDLVQVRDQALLDDDTRTLRQLEAGPALASDLAGCDCPNVLSHEAALGGAHSSPGVTSLVPRQTGYPAAFFSEGLIFSPTGTRLREFIILTRASARQPWKITLDTFGVITGPEAAIHPGAFDRDDFNVLPRSQRIPSSVLLAMLAGQWQSQKLSGRAPAGAPFAADEGAEFGVHHQDTIHDNGLRGHFTFSVDPAAPVYTFGLDHDGVAVCGVIGIDVTWSRGPDGYPYQDPDQTNWGRGLAPGVYRELTEHRLTQPCILLPAAASAPAEVFRGDEAEISTRGTK